MGSRALLALLSPLVFLSVVEFAVATFDLAPPFVDPIVVWNDRRDTEIHQASGEFRFDRRFLWEPRPGAVVFGAPINDGAYRGPFYPPARDATRRIAVLGDSTTYGFGLPETESWGRFLERLLRDNGHDVEVLNFGCVGFTITQGYHLYVERVRGYRPDVVVAAFGAVNESYPALPGLDDEGKIGALTALPYRARAFLRRYDAFRWLESLTGAGEAPAELDEDVLTRRVTAGEFQRRIADLKEAVEADGGRLVLVSPPRRRDGEAKHEVTAEYTRALTETAERLGLPVADVHGEFRALEEQELGAEVADPKRWSASSLFLDFWHPSPKGHRAYAVVVGRTLERASLLSR